MRLLILLPLYALMLFIASAVTVNAITFEYVGICPPALARAEFQKDQLFSLLEGEQGHLGTEVRDMVLAVEDRVCPILGLKQIANLNNRPTPSPCKGRPGYPLDLYATTPAILFFRFFVLATVYAPADRWEG